MPTDGGTGAVSIPEAFDQVLRTSPERVALRCGADALTYRDLDVCAHRVARDLVHRIAPEDLVAVCATVSPQVVAALLGVLRAGGAYLPLDPGLPDARLAMMLADSGVRHVLVRSPDAERIRRLAPPGIDVLAIDDQYGPTVADRVAGTRDLPKLGGTALAYAMYTSGSTGRPKAVLIEHVSVVALARHDRLGIRPQDVLLQLAPLTVDPSVFEIWGALLNGATLVLPPDPRPSLHQIADLLVRYEITVLRLAAPLLAMVVDHHRAALRGLRLLVSGGDRASVRAVREVLATVPDCTVVNGYGPTEATVYATWHPMTRYDEAWPSVPIGTPLFGGPALVLDEQLRPVPPGQVGELCVQGPGLARGYLRDPGKTAACFVPHPSRQGQRVYRTGDRVRLLPDGNLEYLGRGDDQIKVRGYRVELGEVERALDDHPSVREAAVVMVSAVPAGRLTAFVVPVPGAHLAPAEVRARLAAVLPGHMVPSAVTVVGALPRTANGKTDRQRLAALGAVPAAGVPSGDAEMTGAQRMIGAIWARVLGQPVVGADDTLLGLGGDSLAALEILAHLRRECGVSLSLADLMEGSTVRDVARRVAQGSGSPTTRLAPGASVRVPLLPSQEGVWFEDRLAGAGRYNIGRTFIVRGTLDEPGLRRAIRALADRQQAVRTVIAHDADGLWQVSAADGGPAVTLTDLRHLPFDEARQAAQTRIDTAAARQVELGEPLVRIEVLRLADDKWMVDVNLHHLVADDWSCGIFFLELATLYENREHLDESPLPPLEFQFADHVRRERRRQAERRAEVAETLRRRFAGYPGPFELPTDLARPAAPTGNGDLVRLELDAELTAAAAAAARQHGVSRFMLALAAVHVVLSRYAERDDLALGVPVAGRDVPGSDRLIGYFVTMSLARINPPPDATVADLLRHVREVCLELYGQEGVPTHTVAEDVGLGGAPLFQAVVNYQQRSSGTLRLGAAQVTAVPPPPRRTAKFDLSFGFRELGDRVAVEVEFNTDLFRADTVRQLGEHLSNALRWLSAHPTDPLRQARLAGPTEFAALAVGGQVPAVDAAPGPLHELVRAQARRGPDRIAVVGDQETLTYRELDERSDRVAAGLRAAGLRPGSYVAVCLERSPELLVALLAVLKAGAAYVPLDPSHPRDRLTRMIVDAQVALVLSGKGLVEQLFGAEPLGAPTVDIRQLQEFAGPDASPLPTGVGDADTPAYVIYTSGSTGRPRGVVVTHAAVVNTLYGNLRRHPFRPDDIWLQTTSPGFDVAAYEQFMPLLCGATLVYCSDEHRADRGAFTRFVARNGITVLVCVPSFLRALARPNLPSLRILLVAGEPADERDTRHYSATTVVINGYGPTEAAILATTHQVLPDDLRTRVPIGRPLPGTSAFVLDRFGQLAAVGVPGELCLGGAGLAVGYWNDPAATEARFGVVPAVGGQRLYRTGDRVRWLPDGNLDFLGRLDDQVKLRGFRIEPAEIETVLASHPDVAEAAVVLAGEGDDAELVAFVVGQVASDTLRAFVARRLPRYMIPAAFMAVPQIPTNGNGKTDRRELARRAAERTDRPGGEQHRAAAEGPMPAVPTLSTTARVVAALWREILHTEVRSLDDDFFDVGGHSLRLIRLLTRIEEVTGVSIDIRDFLAEPTVGAVVSRIEGRREGVAVASAQAVPEESALLDPSWRFRGTPAVPPRNVLLTGATGLVGMFVLAELLRHTDAEVRCLVRATSQREGRRRLQEVADRYLVALDVANPRLTVDVGNLAAPALGATAATWEALTDVDAIVHAGARVHHLSPYSVNAPTNVRGTAELLRLLDAGRAKRLHHLSTTAVFADGPARQVDEWSSTADERHSPARGYSASKWAAERLIARASTQGAESVVYRLGRVFGDTVHGAVNVDDMFCRLLLTARRLGCYPTGAAARADLLPVDVAARAVVSGVLDDAPMPVQHLHQRYGVDLGAFMAVHDRMFGTTSSAVPLSVWVDRIRAAAAGGTELPALPYLHHLGDDGVRGGARLDSDATVRDLNRRGVTLPAFGPDLIEKCWGYLHGQGHLQDEGVE
ncbi:amino acid adenylation domain-containing protein [Micromonospora profundi]|uniref:non-ribosomal peptide synthetase n=1 Tax=Micromonospora sp. NRRL B-16802 TaxID=1415541 RepID=UPI0006ADE5A7|nr:non-ribosomal peptide synthetase [Micromonospora sp. NRRL B-16802]KOX03182.1 hypothetical protein ADK66_28630 [Micromonospora sp. NRRL B-16802]